MTTKDVRITDSVHVKDSIRVRETADTVWMERWQTVWRERTLYDTVKEVRTDTLAIVRTDTVEKTVEVPTVWSKAGWITAAVLILVIMAYILIKTLFKQH